MLLVHDVQHHVHDVASCFDICAGVCPSILLNLKKMDILWKAELGGQEGQCVNHKLSIMCKF